MLRDNARNPLQPGGLDPVEVDAAIYGSTAGSLTELQGRVVARPTPIMDIWADVRQPRRAVPMAVRGGWTGDPGHVAALLEAWQRRADDAAGQPIITVELLMGRGEGLDVESMPAIAQEWVALARLAASIRQEGLINPISIVQSDDVWLIESGERRWLAYHLLALHRLGTSESIPAIRVDGSGYVWRQARENTARRQLNAIGMARQFALLLMDARAQAGQGEYADFAEMVTDGVCDRRFYAQVAEGNLHRIPRGWAEKIEAAMGLGKVQISQYRDLLALTGDPDIDDALWARADAENWPERALREVKDRLTTVNLRLIMARPGWTLDDLRPEKPVVPTSANLMGQTVRPSNLPSATAPAPRGTQPISRPPLKLKSMDMVEANGILGYVVEEKVVGGQHGYLIFQMSLQRNQWYADAAIFSLGVTYDEFMAGNDGAEAPEPAKSPTAMTSDKASSATLPEADDGASGLIFPDGDPARAVLNTLRVLAQKTGYDAAADALYQMVATQRGDAMDWQQTGEIADVLAEWSNVMSEAFAGWYQIVQGYIQRVDEEARR